MTNLNNLPDVEFAQKDVETILTDTIAGYEQAYFEQTGEKKKLYPGDPVRIFLYSQALREFQLRQIIDFSAKQNLLKYARTDYLDNLGALQGVARLPASKATTTIKFTLSAAQPTVTTIPVSTRVSPGNGIYFQTLNDTEIPAGGTDIEVEVECTTAGTVGNGFTPGQINILVDPIPWVNKVLNTSTSTGGADVEDDDSLRERIRLAPESYSVAGPAGAYEFLAKQYSSAIQDVQVFSPSPGNVDIRILLEGGGIPANSFLDGVAAYLSNKNRRPLTDNLSVKAPEVVAYDVEVKYYIHSRDSAATAAIKSNVERAVQEYILWQKSKIGRDINPSELIARIMKSGAKRVEVTSPIFTFMAGTQVANCETAAVVYGGLEDD